jgi:hypothetical protein
MGEMQFRKVKGYVIAITSCSETISYVFDPGKRPTEKGKCQKFGLTEEIFVTVPLSCLEGKMNLLSLITNDREKAKGERDHEPNATFRKKWDWFKKPDEGISKFPRTGDSGEEDCITENEGQAPASETPQE